MLTLLIYLVVLPRLLSSVSTGTKFHLLLTRKDVSNGGFLLRLLGLMSHLPGPCVKGVISITERLPFEASRSIALLTYLPSKKVILLPLVMVALALPLSDHLGSCYILLFHLYFRAFFFFKGTSHGRLGFRIRCNLVVSLTHCVATNASSMTL